MKKIIFLISLLILSHAFSEKIFACSCYAAPPISVELKSSKAVFTGKVISYRDIEVTEDYKDSKGNTRLLKSTNRVYKLRAIEVLKGDKSRKEFDIDAGSIGSSCFREFTVGDNFLIYASGDDDEKLYGYLVCGLTTYLQENDGQLSFIKELLSGKPEPQIYGNYEEFQKDDRTGKYKKLPKAGVTIALQNENDKYETATDNSGLYRFNNIPQGKYTLKPVNIPPAQETGETIVTISEEGKIAEFLDFGDGVYLSKYISLGTYWNNRIQGTVTDSEGTKLDFASIKLLPADSPDEKIDSDDFFAKAHDGKYFSGNKSPGKYVLAVQVYVPSGDSNFVRFFYPNAESSASAEIIELDAKTELDLNVKIPLALRQIKGVVTWNDDTPIKGDTILLLSKDKEIPKNLLDIKKSSFDLEYADDNGEFALQGFENAEYWLHAIISVESENENDDMLFYRAKPIKIKLGKANDLLRIRVSRSEKSETIF